MRNPAWSSEGVLVVYQKYGYGLKQGQPLYSPDPNLQLRFSGEFPAVSAQGKVAFTPFPHEKGQSPNVPVDVANPDGTDRHTVYQSAGAAMGVTWSPDGQQMVVSQGVMVLNSPLQLALINVADGAVIRTLTDKSVSAAFPSFAPDGKHVVYRVKGKDQTGLRILDLDDGQTRALTTGHDNFPFWSPDGSRICFTRDVGGVQAFDIFTVRPDGSELRHLVNAPGNDAHCGWIRDSRKIIFSSSRLGYRDEAPLYDRALAQPYSELFVMNVDGSNQHPITDDKWEQGTPAVVP
jgi:WD40 repeat protein